jgi:very-short-patch-repair endonuclease
VECDEFQYHADRKAFTNDRERDRFLRDNGFQVLRFSDNEIEIDTASRARELLLYLNQLNQEMFREEIAEDYQYQKA